MKSFSYLVLVLFLTCNCIPLQSAILYRQVASGHSNEFHYTKNLNAFDSSTFKKLYNSLHNRNFEPFPKHISRNMLNSKAFENLKCTSLAKLQVYFSIHDYNASSHLTRVSQYENPYFDNTNQLRFLGPGHVKPYAKMGTPENYLRTDQQPPLIIRFIRSPKGMKGICIKRLQPEFYRIP